MFAVGDRSRIARLRELVGVFGASLLVCCLVCFFFTPSFVIWRGLHIPQAWFYPQLNRAVDVLRQLDNPLEPIETPSNLVINWRLFFPMLGHLLGLPTWAFLSLPHLGCVVVVAFMIWRMHQWSGSWQTAVFVTGTLSAAGWFFASTGWLTYFDSWFVLGLLIISFVQSRPPLVVAGLITPWIDERFLLAIPLCLLTRTLMERYAWRRGTRTWATDLAVIILVVVPYGLVRLVMMLGQESISTDYIHKTLSELQSVPMWRMGEGWWAGFRMGWVYGAIAMLWMWRHQGAWARTVGTLILVFQLLMSFVVAGDLSRNMAMLLPWLFFGAVIATRSMSVWSRRLLPSLFAANLLLPASHVTWSFKAPIFYLYHEIHQWQEPPTVLRPSYHLQMGARQLNANKWDEAREFFDTALLLDPQLADGYIGRGTAYLCLGQLDAARADLIRGLELNPRSADGWYFLGMTMAFLGNHDAATNHLKRALELAPENWFHRQRCEKALADIESSKWAPTSEQRDGIIDAGNPDPSAAAPKSNKE